MRSTDPVANLIFAFHSGMSIDELCNAYALERPVVEGILRLSLSLNRRAMLRYTGRD